METQSELVEGGPAAKLRKRTAVLLICAITGPFVGLPIPVPRRQRQEIRAYYHARSRRASKPQRAIELQPESSQHDVTSALASNLRLISSLGGTTTSGLRRTASDAMSIVTVIDLKIDAVRNDSQPTSDARTSAEQYYITSPVLEDQELKRAASLESRASVDTARAGRKEAEGDFLSKEAVSTRHDWHDIAVGDHAKMQLGNIYGGLTNKTSIVIYNIHVGGQLRLSVEA